jgi:1-acyl-sn-glycerol-3-phosphate acyltransferase
MMGKLFFQRRFAPFFWTMGLGAFNDNLYKSALAILIAYNLPPSQADMIVQLSAGLFILPFFIFSGISGQICDKFEKANLIKWIKLLEVIVMLGGAYGLYLKNYNLLLVILFLMGAQSTLFGPIKYSILPQHLKPQELLPGNGLVSMGTFLSILIGTIAGGLLVEKEFLARNGVTPIALAVVVVAGLGYLSSLFIPQADPNFKDLKIRLNPITETWRTIRLAAVNEHTLLSILAISWFWFFGFFFMASLPSYCRDVIAGNEQVATLLLTAISIGMGLGSVLCHRLSLGHLGLGLMIVGAFGLTVSGMDVYFNGMTAPEGLAAGSFLSPAQFFDNSKNWRALLDLLGIGIFGGFFIVPLYTHLQQHSPVESASQLIASNNIVNSIFMVAAAVMAMGLFALGLNILQIFLVVSLLNLVVACLLLWKLPPHFYHLFFTYTMKLIYPRLKIQGKENLPKIHGPTLVVSNHVSFIDPLLVAAAMNRPPRFVMDKSYYDWKILGWFFTSSRSIPITPKKIDPELMNKALDKVIDGLKRGEMIVLFPEGFITKDGEMIPFKDGVERISRQLPELQIIPVAIAGMWGSWFSRIKGKALAGIPPNRILPQVRVCIGQVMRAQEVRAEGLQQVISNLRGELR